ncbi:MAG: hypothetical protein ACI8W8_002449 [Rhodothermales bacterium]|jgi:hypothetical protein
MIANSATLRVCGLLVACTLGAAPLEFNRDIRPILSDKCFSCHGPSSHREADLRLDTFAGATDEAIVPGKPEASPLIDRILTDDPDDIMPPPDSHKSLSAEEKTLLQRWIREGATYQKHWSFLPLNAPADTRIDALVRPQLPRADKRTLIRRVTLDLTGLPPTERELRNFLANSADDAYERLIDRLLSSPRYGEHMAKYWLDLVRYGDSHGIHADNYREMFLYRDWVIKAFNANQPFDEFTLDQIAGDLRPARTTEQLIASGFNRLHISNSAGSALKEELYVNNVTDRVNAIGSVYLGLTVGCAACHDHKYDPITQKEYYQLFAFFNNLDGPPDNKGHKSPAPNLSVPTEAHLILADNLRGRIEAAPDSRELRKKLAAIESQAPGSTLIMKERAQPRPAYILLRGEYDNPGEQVERATPAVLPPMSPGMSRDRLGFAQWLVDPQHPLTARVAVNRFWQQLFGVGLVKTSEDLGSQGEWPSHPELLDSLAQRFIRSGWDVKALMQRIVTSQTYTQGADAGADAYAADPENRRLARGPRFRMDAEMLRDQALFVSGQLVETMYGPSVKPPQPPGLWKSVSLPGVSRPDRFTPDTGPATLRRSVYTYWKRAYPPPVMSIFNAPNRETCVARRERTNTPLQALVLMNEAQFFESARQLARLSIASSEDDASRLTWAYERLTAHQPSAPELELLQNSLRDLRAHFVNSADGESQAWTLVMNALLNLDIVKSKQ